MNIHDISEIEFHYSRPVYTYPDDNRLSDFVGRKNHVSG